MSSTFGDQPALASQPKTKWLKRVLIPFWVIRVCLIILLIASYSASLYFLSQQKYIFDEASSDNEVSHNVYGGVLAIFIVFIVVFVICLILDVISMVMLGRHSLKPKTFLIFQVIETTIWVIIFILEMIGTGRTGTGAGIAWLLSLVLLVSFVALLIYASVVYHRARVAARSGGVLPISELTTTAYEPVSNPYGHAYANYSSQNVAPGGMYQPPLASPEIRVERYG